MPKAELAAFYPSLMVTPTDSRYYSIDTLYAVCEAGLLAQLLDFLENHTEVDVSYVNLFHDVRSTMDGVHQNGSLKVREAASAQFRC